MSLDIPMVDIELVKGCTISCRWCSVRSKRQLRFMGTDLFERIVEECARERFGHRRLSLFLGGEPLLHPRFEELLGIMRRHRVHELEYENVQIFTNGVTNPQLYPAIVKSGVIKLVRFSIDGCGDRESYEYMRPPARWDDVVANLRRMIELRDRFNPGLSVRLTTLIPHQDFVPFPVPDYDEAVRRFEKQFAGLGVDEIGHRKIGTLQGKEIPLPERYYGKKRICLLVKDLKLAVNFDGSVSTCSNDLNAGQLLGHVGYGGLGACWRSDRFQDFLAGKRRGEQNPLGYCSGCDRNAV